MKILATIRRILFLWMGPVVIAIVGAWLYYHGGRYVNTDNAYLKADKVSISTEISGKVVEVYVADHDRVHQGDVLFRVDDQPYRIALARAEANLVKVRGDIESLKADYLNKTADIAKAQTDLDYYRKEYTRLSKLAETESISRVQVDQAEYQAQHAQNELDVTRQALKVVKARLIDPDLPVEQHPDYQLALAAQDKAMLDLSHVETFAPSDGIIANFNMRKGEYLAAGVPLFTLVDDSNIWLEANFKETDLTYLRTGQPVEVKVDTFPDVSFTGKVASITPGTGSEFSLLPSQNSTGNWVKVVQRISVHIDLDMPPDRPPLTAGMSAEVKVDTGHIRHLPWDE